MMTELPDFVDLCARYEKLPPGAKAELRRVAEAEDLSLTSALYRLFPGQRPDERRLRVAYLLPWCRHAANAKPIGAQLAEAKVAEARVLQTARARPPLDLVQLRRLAMHIKAAVDWSVFGRALWYWNERSKRELVEDFYLARFGLSKGEER